MEEKKPTKNEHQGHRERLRQKVIKNGINSLAEHEVLELILFYSLAQRNTNDLAHKLINRFGSVAAVLDAPQEQLLEIKGISKTTVFVLKSLPQIASYYLEDKNGVADKIYGCEDAFKLLAPKFIGKTSEELLIVFLSNSNKFLGCEFIAKGDVNSTQFTSRQLIEPCIRYNATQVILAHNHPSDILIPSPDDVITTKNVCACLHTIEVVLLDHIIFGKNSCFSMNSSEQYKNLFIPPKK